MKIVCIGDLLLTSDMMKAAVEKDKCYDKACYFDFGPEDRNELRQYVRLMETEGFHCANLPDEIYHELEDADVLQVHLAPVPQKVFEVAKKLKLILSNRGGTENIDLQSATKHNVAVLCNPAHNANAVAEMTLALILAETRNIARNHLSLVKDKKWYENPPNAGNIHELCSLTIGLVGYGTIGKIVAKLLEAHGSKVLVYDPFIKVVEEPNVELSATLEDLLRKSDIVSLHARVSDSTKNLIGEKELELMKPSAMLVNTARAALIDMDALYKALEKKRIMGAALDVFPVEPLPVDYPFLELDNVTLVCHKGGDTVESYQNSPGMLLKEAENFFSGTKEPAFFVNKMDRKRSV